MKTLYFATLLLLSVSLSCRNENTTFNDYTTIEVDLKTQKIEENSPAFTKYSIVGLETTEESLLGDVAKVVCNKDKMYILSMMNPTLFIFNRSGKFQSKLAKGQGPGEVTFVSDVAVFRDTLYVLDMYRSIKAYDLNGNYIEEKIKSDAPYFSMAFTQEGVYLLDPNISKKSDHNVHFISSDGTEKKFLPKNEFLKEVSIATYNFMRNDYVVWPLSDIIYKKEKNGSDIIPACLVDFKGEWISGQQYKEAVTNKEMCSGDLDKYARWLKDFMPIKDKGYFFSFKYDRDYFVKYLDGKVSLFTTLLSDLPEMKQEAVGSVNDSLIYVYTPEALQDYGSEHPNQQNEKLHSLYELAKNEDMNQVLFFIPVNE